MEVRLAHPDELPACLAVRRAVFVEEQKVPLCEDLDGRDSDCVHVAAFDGEVLVGTARISIVAGGDAKVQRVAVLAAHRGRGLGHRIMALVEDQARRLGCARVVLDAQVAVIPFYERRGYSAEGAVFLDAGIRHRFMWRSVGGRRPTRSDPGSG